MTTRQSPSSWIAAFALLVPLYVYPTTLAEIDVSATVPEFFQMEVNGQAHGTVFDLPVQFSSDPQTANVQKLTGIIEIADAITIGELTANHPLDIKIKLQEWAGNPSSTPTLQFRVRDVQQSAGSMAAIASSWVSLGPSGIALFRAGELTPEGFLRGLRGGSCVVDVRAVFSPGSAPEEGWMASVALESQPLSP